MNPLHQGQPAVTHSSITHPYLLHRLTRRRGPFNFRMRAICGEVGSLILHGNLIFLLWKNTKFSPFCPGRDEAAAALMATHCRCAKHPQQPCWSGHLLTLQSLCCAMPDWQRWGGANRRDLAEHVKDTPSDHTFFFYRNAISMQISARGRAHSSITGCEKWNFLKLFHIQEIFYLVSQSARFLNA